MRECRSTEEKTTVNTRFVGFIPYVIVCRERDLGFNHMFCFFFLKASAKAKSNTARWRQLSLAVSVCCGSNQNMSFTLPRRISAEIPTQFPIFFYEVAANNLRPP